MVHGRHMLLLSLLAATSCAAIANNTQGPMQPQSVAGPCTVKRFFLLGLRSVPADMEVVDNGQACTFTIINPALNAVINAALLTRAPEHGQARVERVNGARQAAVSYTPERGFTGPDKFDITLEPGAVGVTINVTVGPQR